MAYVGFSKLKASIASRGGVRDPGAVAAAIGRKKYGKPAFQRAAARGTSMRGMAPARASALRMRAHEHAQQGNMRSGDHAGMLMNGKGMPHETGGRPMFGRAGTMPRGRP